MAADEEGDLTIVVPSSMGIVEGPIDGCVGIWFTIVGEDEGFQGHQFFRKARRAGDNIVAEDRETFDRITEVMGWFKGIEEDALTFFDAEEAPEPAEDPATWPAAWVEVPEGLTISVDDQRVRVGYSVQGLDWKKSVEISFYQTARANRAFRIVDDRSELIKAGLGRMDYELRYYRDAAAMALPRSQLIYPNEVQPD